ncbi:MAG: DUF4426 domain-containing protein [Pseudomonadota bacterium]
MKTRATVTRNVIKQWILAAMLLVVSCASWAGEKVFGDYVVYYSVFTSDFLQPKIAQRHGITRSHDRVLLNVTVHKRGTDKNGKKSIANNVPVKAIIKGSASDLIHSHFIKFKPVIEPNALYYIGDFKAPGRQVYIVDLDITPEGKKRSFNLRFNHEIFALKE